MMRKIPVVENVIEYDDTRLELFVDFQDPTKFIFTDKSITPLLLFTCDHNSMEDLQKMITQIHETVMQEWRRLHKTQDQRLRINEIATDQNINIVIDNTRKFAE